VFADIIHFYRSKNLRPIIYQSMLDDERFELNHKLFREMNKKGLTNQNGERIISLMKTKVSENNVPRHLYL